MGDNRRLIHVIDPDPFTFASVQLLAGEEYRVRSVTSWETAREALERERPEAIVCEYGVDGRSGLRFRDAIREGYPGARSTRFVFVSTADLSPAALEPGDFWIHKRDLPRYLLPALRLVTAPLERRNCELLFRIERRQELTATLEGDARLSRQGPPADWTLQDMLPQESEWQLPPGPDPLNRQGAAVFKGIFGIPGDGDETAPWGLLDVAGDSFAPYDTRLRFAGSWESLELPLEFLRDPKRSRPIAVDYPLTRLVSGAQAGTVPLSPALRRQLVRERRGLRVLIVNREGADGLVEKMSQWFRLPGGKEVEAVELKPEDATRKALEKALAEPQRWDLLHYNGHGRLDKAGPASLQLHGENPGEPDDWLTAPELAELVKGRGLHFVSLGCCWGVEARSGPSPGHPVPPPVTLAQGLSHAGIPAFLVFRGRHDLNVLASFFYRFYGYLGDRWELEQAIGRARADAFREQMGLVWAASVMVLQK